MLFCFLLMNCAFTKIDWWCKEQSLAGKEVGEPSQAPLCRAANTFWIRELSSRTSLSLHVVDLGHLAPLNLGSLIPKTW